MNGRTRRITIFALAGAGLLAAGTALGAGLPPSGTGGAGEQGSLWYSGELTTAAGVPVTGASPLLTVKLWSDPTATGAAFLECTSPPRSVSVTAGHFRLALDRDDDACVRAVHANPQLWVGVQVGSDPELTPRTPLGAVPYALEAARVSISGPSGTVSIGGYCGATPSRTGDLGGYVGARDLCRTACSSSSAHMCTGMELALSVQAGRVMPASIGWYASGQASDASSSVLWGGSVAWAEDCYGYTTGDSTVGSSLGPITALGAGWMGSRPHLEHCDVSHPILCCD